MQNVSIKLYFRIQKIIVRVCVEISGVPFQINYSFETNLGTTLVCSEILLTKFRDFFRFTTISSLAGKLLGMKSSSYAV